MTNKNRQSEYVTKPDLKEGLQQVSAHIIGQIIDKLTSQKEEIESAMAQGFSGVYERIHTIESTMATKNDILKILDKTASNHQFDQLAGRVTVLEEKIS